jgi:threonine/homoserine/homoserine lactone efflux protein
MMAARPRLPLKRLEIRWYNGKRTIAKIKAQTIRAKKGENTRTHNTANRAIKLRRIMESMKVLAVNPKGVLFFESMLLIHLYVDN